MKIAIALLILWALTSCYETTVTTRTPFGDISIRTPASTGDGKTMLSPHYPQPTPSPTPDRKWWQF